MCLLVCVGDSSARPWSHMLARQDTEGEEATDFTVRRVSGPVHISHHNWGLLQTE